MRGENETVNVTEVIDRNLSRYQLSIFLLCAMVVFLDGIDTQVVGIGAPLIGRELGIDKALFGWVFSAGTLGATIGAFACGVIADRVGRKKTLIVATVLFGLCTLATSYVSDFEGLLLSRFATGLGLGGAVPCFVALTSEYAPAHRRATIVSLLWAGFPLGAALGALINSYIVHAIGWRPLFVVWGIAPIGVALVHLILLPESARFLLDKGNNAPRVARLLRKIEPHSRFDGKQLVAEHNAVQRSRPADLFGPSLRTASLSLSIIAFVVFGLLTVTASWMPSLLTPFGYSASAGALVVAFNGFGSFVGTTGAGFLLERVGIVRTALPALIGTVVSFIALALATDSFELVGIASFASGLCLGISSSSVLALAAITYPTSIRSTGVGWAMGMGRFGSVISPLLVSTMMQAEWRLLAVMIGLSIFAATAIPAVTIIGRVGAARRKLLETATSASA